MLLSQSLTSILQDEGQGDKRKGKKRRGGRGRAASPDRPPAASHLVSSFFQGHAAVAGSRRTLADLQLEGLAGETGDDAAAASLRDLLAALPERHAAEKAALRRRLAAQFGRWWAQLRTGNSLLFYGFGSKHELLQRFAREQLGRGDGACLAVNGLQPGLTAKQVGGKKGVEFLASSWPPGGGFSGQVAVLWCSHGKEQQAVQQWDPPRAARVP